MQKLGTLALALVLAVGLHVCATRTPAIELPEIPLPNVQKPLECADTGEHYVNSPNGAVYRIWICRDGLIIFRFVRYLPPPK